MGSAAKASGGRAMVTVFDGTRQPCVDLKDLLLTVTDGNQRVVSRDFHNSSSTLFSDLPIFNNLGDNYTFLASLNGYKDAGFFPVHVSAGITLPVNLMLLPQSNAFNFAAATWEKISIRPKLKLLLANGAEDEAAAASRYSDLEDRQDGAILACILNITTAADQIWLPQGTLLDYLKQLIWNLEGNSHLAPDRFYAWADPAILGQLEAAKVEGTFVDAPYWLHPGATRSYKQVDFGEANVQVTFHEEDTLAVDGKVCVKVELDIDYYKDLLAHLLLEVAVNAFGSLTDPRTVYALRWMAGQRAGIPEFDPLYTIVRA